MKVRPQTDSSIESLFNAANLRTTGRSRAAQQPSFQHMISRYTASLAAPQTAAKTLISPSATSAPSTTPPSLLPVTPTVTDSKAVVQAQPTIGALANVGPPSSWHIDPTSRSLLVWDPTATNGVGDGSTGNFLQTHGFTFDAMPDLATIRGFQNMGQGIKITDPTGQRAPIEILPSDNFLDVARANNLTLNAADGGANYALATAMSAAYQAGKSTDEALAAARTYMAGQGFSADQIAAAIVGPAPGSTNLGVSQPPAASASAST